MPGISEYVFHADDGQRRVEFVRSWNTAWRKARKEAGLPGLLLHDFRRSAVRNMSNAGVRDVVAMKITGHKTPSMYRRYNIVNEADKVAALEKTQAHVQGARCSAEKVTAGDFGGEDKAAAGQDGSGE